MNKGVALQPKPLSEEDALRANLYGLLSRLLFRPPDAAVLEIVRGLTGDGSELGKAFSSLAAKATTATREAAA